MMIFGNEIRDLKHLKVGDQVYVDASTSAIGGTTYRVAQAKVEKITPSGIVTVRVGDTERRWTFQPNNRERGNKWGASIISPEKYEERLRAASEQQLERAAQRAINAISELGRHASKSDRLEKLRAALAAVEATPNE